MNYELAIGLNGEYLSKMKLSNYVGTFISGWLVIIWDEGSMLKSHLSFDNIKLELGEHCSPKSAIKIFEFVLFYRV